MAIIKLYNPCEACQGEEIGLIDDIECELSNAGGMRAVCLRCGRNTAQAVWNNYNGVEAPQEA